MNGSDYIVDFLSKKGVTNIFTLTGGACAFIIDAISRNNKVSYTCFQHEQSSAMAADSIWRTNKLVGVTVSTSGPGATNLVTGIACSYFDSIPTFHITGQVDSKERSKYNKSLSRQIGFQETNIVDMVKPITKYAVKVNNINRLGIELEKSWNIALSGRMGPVLIDIPIDIQKAEINNNIITKFNDKDKSKINNSVVGGEINSLSEIINAFFKNSERPLVLFGAGVGLSGAGSDIENFLNKEGVPFVSSWNGATYFNHRSKNYVGLIGVYGSRSANFAIQSCDKLLVLGSRLDNRQTGGNIKNFAISAKKVIVLDIDNEELKKYKDNRFESFNVNLSNFNLISSKIKVKKNFSEWKNFLSKIKNRNHSDQTKENDISPKNIFTKLSNIVNEDSVIIGDTGANLCWLYQFFKRTKQKFYTAGGHSPMGYSLPAAIGASIMNPKKQIISISGDGGFQLNLQELQTIKNYNLNIIIFIINNNGYGIIKQFQDSYFNSRYEASGFGYSCPNFNKISDAYEIDYIAIKSLETLNKDIISNGPKIIEIFLDQNTLIQPKIEFGHLMHDQFPYLSDMEFEYFNKYCIYDRNLKLKIKSD